MRRNFATIDLDTGEIVEGVPVYTPRQHKVGFQMWLAVSNEAWQVLLARKFDGNTLRVWMALLMNCDWHNAIKVSQREMADQIGMDSANFSRYLNKLVDAGLVVKTNEDGRRQKLAISIYHVWKGKAVEHKAAVDEDMKQARKRAKSSPSPAVP
jgi:predicted transcriptional regulator